MTTRIKELHTKKKERKKERKKESLLYIYINK